MKAGLAIFDILSTDATVAPLVTEGSYKKIFPTQIKQGTSYPAIVYTAVSNVPNETKTSASQFDQVRMQLDIYARTYSEAATLNTAVRNALDRWNGGQVGTAGGVTVKGISYININEALEEADNVHRISADYQVIIDPSL